MRTQRKAPVGTGAHNSIGGPQGTAYPAVSLADVRDPTVVARAAARPSGSGFARLAQGRRRAPIDLAAEHHRGIGLLNAVDQADAVQQRIELFIARSEEHTSELQSPCNLV